MDDLISRQAAIEAVNGVIAEYIPTLYGRYEALPLEMTMAIKRLPTAEPRLSEDDKEVIRIHLGAVKEKLCNQRRWDEAQEYEGIIERLNGCHNCGAKMEAE